MLAGAIALTGCDKLPLLAPTGSVITLIATSNVLAANGTIDVIATVIEQGAAGGGTGSTTGQGTPVHNGTVVTFTSTIGRLEPREARTHNGQVTVKLSGDGRSGVAKVTAYSGGASASLDVNVGAAAAERIVLTGTPQQLPAAGGTVALSARVEDVSGNGLGGIEVSFSTTAGTVAPPSAVTNEFGVAEATLTTTQAADVTASAGGKASAAPFKVTLAARTGITLTPPSATPTAGLASSYGVSVASASNV
ncbi:MAG TPA: Ig-like domain-containing protein, partial [Phycisphaerae bacterium]|nr:Ig-like domain-containing protein [Phycisphaerae bacterium]